VRSVQQIDARLRDGLHDEDTGHDPASLPVTLARPRNGPTTSLRGNAGG
jgi:hypothetical protein